MLPAMRLRGFWLALVIALGLALAACTSNLPGGPQGTLVPGGPQGTLVGEVVAGPTCPVANAENPCPPAPVPNRQVRIETFAGAVAATVTTDAEGHFTIHLPPGHYVIHVAIIPGQVGFQQVTPSDVTIVAGQATSITIELDTGIR
jgi:hypothetical protein